MVADEVTDHSVLCSCFCLRQVQRRIVHAFPTEARSEEVQTYSRAYLSLERRVCFEFLLDVEVLHASSHVFGVRVDDVIDPFMIISFEAARDMIFFNHRTERSHGTRRTSCAFSEESHLRTTTESSRREVCSFQ